MSDYVLVNGELCKDEDLTHHGVLGMKWGHRKTNPTTGYIKRGNAAQSMYKKARNQMKTARKSGDKQRYQKAKESYKKVARETRSDRARRYNSMDRVTDKVAYGKRGQARIEKRIDKGDSRAVAYGKEIMRTALTSASVGLVTMDALTGGAIHRAAVQSGKTAVKKFMETEVSRRSVIKIAQNAKFDPIDVAYKVLK